MTIRNQLGLFLHKVAKYPLPSLLSYLELAPHAHLLMSTQSCLLCARVLSLPPCVLRTLCVPGALRRPEDVLRFPRP